MQANADRWVVLCGSMSMYPLMLEEERYLKAAGVTTRLPIPEDDIQPRMTPEEYTAFKRTASLAHFQAIADPRTFAILAVNGDKRGVRDYIGPNTFAEIVVAFSRGKRVYLSQAVPFHFADELHAWGVIPLYGNLDRLVADFHAAGQALLAQEAMPLG
jgi:hypothetical protein